MQHRRRSQTNAVRAPHPDDVLPAEKTQALNMLIRVTQNLISISDRESQALAQNDLLSFAILQDEKAGLAEEYARVSVEFREKINSYRGADKTLLNRLEAMQNDLGEKTRNNNTMVTALYDRSRASTQSALLAAQEIGQRVHVRFDGGREHFNEETSR